MTKIQLLETLELLQKVRDIEIKVKKIHLENVTVRLRLGGEKKL